VLLQNYKNGLWMMSYIGTGEYSDCVLHLTSMMRRLGIFDVYEEHALDAYLLVKLGVKGE